MSQLIGPAAQLKFTIATMIQSPSNGFLLSPHFLLRDPHLPTANRPVGESADKW